MKNRLFVVRFYEKLIFLYFYVDRPTVNRNNVPKKFNKGQIRSKMLIMQTKKAFHFCGKP